MNDILVERRTFVSALVRRYFLLRRRTYLSLRGSLRINSHLSAGQRSKARVSKDRRYFDSRLALEEKALIPIPTSSDTAAQAVSGGKVLAEIRNVEMLKKNILALEVMAMRLNELISALEKAAEVFANEFHRVKSILYPFGIFSVIAKNIKKLFGKSYYSAKEIKEIASLNELCALTAAVADTCIDGGLLLEK